jgi:hypothetical protein
MITLRRDGVKVSKQQVEAAERLHEVLKPLIDGWQMAHQDAVQVEVSILWSDDN